MSLMSPAPANLINLSQRRSWRRQDGAGFGWLSSPHKERSFQVNGRLNARLLIERTCTCLTKPSTISKSALSQSCCCSLCAPIQKSEEVTLRSPQWLVPNDIGWSTTWRWLWQPQRSSATKYLAWLGGARDKLAVEIISLTKLSKSLSSSSQPRSLPDSDHKHDGGISDDAGERLSPERKHLSGKVLHPEVLKSWYSRSRSMSTAVHLQLGLVMWLNLMTVCLWPGPVLGGHHCLYHSHDFRFNFCYTTHKCSRGTDMAQKKQNQTQWPTFSPPQPLHKWTHASPLRVFWDK